MYVYWSRGYGGYNPWEGSYTIIHIARDPGISIYFLLLTYVDDLGQGRMAGTSTSLIMWLEAIRKS